MTTSEKQIYIEKILNNGMGLARLEETDGRKRVLFVKGGIPGEIVTCKQETDKKTYFVAEIDKLILSSPYRKTPDCPYFTSCGGCDFQHIDFGRQMAIKKDILSDLLMKNAKIAFDKDISYFPSIEFKYRNKISLTGEKSFFGLLAEGTNRVVKTEKCMIADDRINSLIAQINSLKFPSEIVKKIQIRVSSLLKTMVVLYTEIGSSAEYIPLFSLINADTVILLTKDGRSEIVKGSGYLTDIIEGLSFKYSHSNFMQVNRTSAEMIYDYLKNRIKVGKRLLDVYSGVGLHAILFSHLFKTVYSIEGSASSVYYQRINAKENKINNLKIIKSMINDSFKIDSDLKFDTLISDPPREGMSQLLLKNISEHVKETFIYISCNPATLSRDAGVLLKSGFKIDEIAIFDMFPQTRHFETVVFFKK